MIVELVNLDLLQWESLYNSVKDRISHNGEAEGLYHDAIITTTTDDFRAIVDLYNGVVVYRIQLKIYIKLVFIE